MGGGLLNGLRSDLCGIEANGWFRLRTFFDLENKHLYQAFASCSGAEIFSTEDEMTLKPS